MTIRSQGNSKARYNAVWQATGLDAVNPYVSPAIPGGGGSGELDWGGNRGVWGGGTGYSDVMDYVKISVTGDATDFGNLTVARQGTAGCSNGSRGCFTYGYDGSNTNVIDYITIASPGNATDFGDITSARSDIGANNNATRACFGGGYTNTNIIDYVTISSTGNATDFGDLTVTRSDLAATSNTSRGIWCGGYESSYVNTIDYVTIANTGNATDFGDLTQARRAHGGGDANRKEA